MPTEFNGETYLTQAESIDHLGIGFNAFKKVCQDYGLRFHKRLAGRTKYFKQADLDAIPRIKLVEEPTK